MRPNNKFDDKEKFVCCDGSGCDVCREEEALGDNNEDN